jgi:hypothetical protein
LVIASVTNHGYIVPEKAGGIDKAIVIPYNGNMNDKDFTPQEQAIWDEAFNAGLEAENNSDAIDEAFSRGWDEGWDMAKSDSDDGNDQNDDYDDGYHSGFVAGAEAEQARVQSVLKTMMEASINLGQGNKAIQYKHAMELLRPIQIDYSEEAYQRGLEEDGF